jgi:hypothetical protein
MKKTYSGGCHCGAVHFEADVDLSKGTFKCNCSICTKTRLWGIEVVPGTFRLTAGESDLGDYQPFGVHHVFCRRCGVRSFAWGENPQGETFHVVRVNCLEDVDVDELMAAPVTYFDGRHDDYTSPPAETRHL